MSLSLLIPRALYQAVTIKGTKLPDEVTPSGESSGESSGEEVWFLVKRDMRTGNNTTVLYRVNHTDRTAYPKE